MIVECERCGSKFNFDRTLIKEEGSKVRCSRCKNVFTLYPSQTEAEEDQALFQNLEEELEETVALDSPPVFDQEETGTSSTDDKVSSDFDQAFQEAIEEESFDEVEEIGIDDEEFSDIEEAPDLAEKGKKGLMRKGKKKREKKVKADETVEEISPGKRRDRSAKRFLIILFIILFLIIFLGVVYFFLPDYRPSFLSSQRPVPAETLTDKGVKNLSFKDVSGSFVQSEVAGQRFVIKGKISNNYSDPRRYILAKAEILDDKGNVIQRKLAYAGNVFTENELKRMPMVEIDQLLKNRMGRNDMNVNIMPQEDVPFMIIFENLPPNLSEFSVEAVSSSPGE